MCVRYSSELHADETSDEISVPANQERNEPVYEVLTCDGYHRDHAGLLSDALRTVQESYTAGASRKHYRDQENREVKFYMLRGVLTRPSSLS